MRRILPKALAASIAASAALGLAASAQAAIDFIPCSKGNDFACAHLSVPLDPGGVVAGTVSLAIKRHRAAVGEARSAIVALAGGPGQSALPFAEQFAELLGPIAATRDLIVFDQRGTGKSGALSCHAFERLSEASSPGTALAECATQLGPSRAFYTSADTVADIEAIRQAGGYEKLVLYGTSYGTKVAELYAQEHPEHVEALVLDSVVPPNGPDTLNRPTFAAIPRVLRQICAGGACHGLTANPVADLARLLRRMRHGPLRVRAFGRSGHEQTVTITPEALLDVLLAGDFSGGLRADLVTAVRSAALGDTAPIGRLFETLNPGEDEEEDFDGPLYFATTCEEQAFPFSRAATPAGRLSESIAAADSQAGDFLPFSAADAIGFSDIPACIHWHYSTPAPSPDQAPLPDVPTLILSGADDLRTPTANAREVARQIPGSQLLVVPYVGHSVLGEDPTSCAQTALQALFVSGRIHPCRPEREPAALRPAPAPPRTLAQVSPAAGYSGLPGRTARAIRLTIADLGRQLGLVLESSGSIESLLSGSGLSTGGLRSGWAALQDLDIDFHDYSFVPGLTISGKLGRETAALRIGGSAAAAGTLHMGPHRMLVGDLGGVTVRLPASPKAAAAIVGADAPTSAEQDPGNPAARARARLLARRLERILGP